MEKLKGICILILTFFSFGLTVFFMPFQVYEVFSALDSEVLEAEIIDSSELINKELKNSNLPDDIRIGAILRKDDIIIPTSKFIECESE